MLEPARNPAEGLRAAASLERAAGVIARLDSAVAHHPLAPAWAYRARLDAVRRQAAVDGKIIDPWHLAALIEGVRLRVDHVPPMLERGLVFAAGQHAFGLYRWLVKPDEAQRAAISEAAAQLAGVGDRHSPLLGAALGVHAWLDRGGEREPLRAALAMYWPRRGVTALACPLLTGVAALRAEVPWTREVWIGEFLDALAAEAADGIALMAALERHWFAARRAVAGRRRDSRASAAVDILAAAPLVSATTLGQALGMAIKNATRLLEGFVVLGIASEVTHRSKRRLYGLKHLAPLRETAAPPRRPRPGRRPGRPSGAPFPMSDGTESPVPAGSVRPPSPPLPPLERREFEFGELDRWLDLADQAIRRTQRVLDETVQVASVPRGGSSAPPPMTVDDRTPSGGIASRKPLRHRLVSSGRGSG
jgi:hypothetical protein